MNQSNTCHPEIFQGLFFKFHGAIRRFLYYKSGVWSATEDLAQEAFLRLWKNCADVPPEKAGSFLYTVANRLFLDETRKQQVAFKFGELNPSIESTNHSPEYEMEMKEFKTTLENAIAQLPENQRVVFLLNRIDKFTYTEIAAQLDISVKAVEKRMHLALIELRKITAKI